MKYSASMKWAVLEIKIPKALDKSPKAAEQIFAGLHGMHIPIKKREEVFKGKVHDWFSFETVSDQGETHYYIRTVEQYKSLVEAQIYAQYPDAEISEVPDYVNKLPKSLPDEKYDLFGSEITLTKPDAYPIRTYEEYEDRTAGKDVVKRIDPLASLCEVLGSLHRDEHIWVQVVIRPTGSAWTKKAQVEIDKILDKPSKAAGGLLSKLFFAVDKQLPGGFEGDSAVKDDKKTSMMNLTPGKRDAIEAIEKSTAKLGHETIIRFVYIAPRDSFHRAHVSGIIGAYKQFSSLALNGFKPVARTMPIAKYLFKGYRNNLTKKILLSNFKNRALFKKAYVLNTEELATIYHFPDVGVRAPLLPRVESKKGEPPAGLPTI